MGSDGAKALGVAVAVGMAWIAGCRTADRGSAGGRVNGGMPEGVQAPPGGGAAGSSGDLVEEEPRSMAREDQERARQATEPGSEPARRERPERPLRPVTR